MKSIFSLFAGAFLSLSHLAHANLTNLSDGQIAKACFQAQDPKFGTYTAIVSIYKSNGYHYASVSYVTSENKGLGGYIGRILSESDIKKSGQTVSVEGVTLNDGADGYIDNAKITITSSTVAFSSGKKPHLAKPKVACPK